jgi:hypothetical protein
MQELQQSTRLADPSIVSVIFAPKLKNYTALSVNLNESSADWAALDCFVEADQILGRNIYENLGKAIRKNALLISECLRMNYSGNSTTISFSLPGILPLTSDEGVPARNYPFASHIDLLSSPVEGLDFDADDFYES